MYLFCLDCPFNIPSAITGLVRFESHRRLCLLDDDKPLHQTCPDALCMVCLCIFTGPTFGLNSMVNVGKYTIPIEHMGWWNSTTGLLKNGGKKPFGGSQGPIFAGCCHNKNWTNDFSWSFPMEVGECPSGCEKDELRFQHGWVVVSNIFCFHAYMGKIPILTSIFFQMGWFNHHPAKRRTKNTDSEEYSLHTEISIGNSTSEKSNTSTCLGVRCVPRVAGKEWATKTLVAWVI